MTRDDLLLHLKDLRDPIAGHRPVLLEQGSSRAAVSAVLVGERDPSLLFIERARKAGDPWSGQMAFPGGRYEEGDGTLKRTAERETLEEVGLDLSEARFLGRLDDQSGRRAGRSSSLVISMFVYELDELPELELNHEVESVHWVPLSRLLDTEYRIDYRFPKFPVTTFPGIVVGEQRHVVWGLTYRMLTTLFEILGVDFEK